MAIYCNNCISPMGDDEELRTCPTCGMRVCPRCLPNDKKATGPCAYCEDLDERESSRIKGLNKRSRGE